MAHVCKGDNVYYTRIMNNPCNIMYLPIPVFFLQTGENALCILSILLTTGKLKSSSSTTRMIEFKMAATDSRALRPKIQQMNTRSPCSSRYMIETQGIYNDYGLLTYFSTIYVRTLTSVSFREVVHTPQSKFNNLHYYMFSHPISIYKNTKIDKYVCLF